MSSFPRLDLVTPVGSHAHTISPSFPYARDRMYTYKKPSIHMYHFCSFFFFSLSSLSSLLFIIYTIFRRWNLHEIYALITHRMVVRVRFVSARARALALTFTLVLELTRSHSLNKTRAKCIWWKRCYILLFYLYHYNL